MIIVKKSYWKFSARMLIAAVLAAPGSLAAQNLISAGVGVGAGVGDRNKDESGRGAHGAAFVQLRPPLLPVALRADALLSRTANAGTAVSLMGDAVLIVPVPFVQPYALVGYGTYGVGKSQSQSGWNAGVGVRVQAAGFGIFGEARRHQRISRDLFTIGIAL